jgi:hypothetical protein
MPDRPRGSGAAHQRPGRDGAAEGVTFLRGLKTPEAANVGHRTPARAGRSRVAAHARLDGANTESRPGSATSTLWNLRARSRLDGASLGRVSPGEPQRAVRKLLPMRS